MFRVYHAFLSVRSSLVVTCWKRANLLALLYVIFSCVLSLSHVVSWVRCGTWLYRFLICAFWLTFIKSDYVCNFIILISFKYIWAATWDFQQCDMCDQQRLRPVCAYAQSDQSLCKSLERSMTVKLLVEQHLEFLGLRVSCTGPSESTHVKMPHFWKSHVVAHIIILFTIPLKYFILLQLSQQRDDNTYNICDLCQSNQKSTRWIVVKPWLLNVSMHMYMT